jgi:hypothetical protein
MRMSLSRAWVHSGVQLNVKSFFRRPVRGLAMCANLGMNGCWKPSTPKVLCTSLTNLRVLGHSLIPAIFEGLIMICLFPRCTPRKSILVLSNSHFDGFKKYKCSLKMSSKRWFIFAMKG